MGGFGSGHHWHGGGKGVCEQMKRIDLREFRRRGWLRSSRRGSLNWSMGGEPAGSIGYRILDGAMELSYRARDPGEDDWRDVSEKVAFVFTGQRLGGERLWFACPGCGRRCAVLYGGALFRCRRCCRLAYQSQNEGPRARSITQAQKFRQRLGGSGALDEPFPGKPAGMHRQTYKRLITRGHRLDSRADAWDAVLIARMAGLFTGRRE